MKHSGLHYYLLIFAFLMGCAKSDDFGVLDAPSQETVSLTTGYDAVVRVVGPGGFGLCSGTFIDPRVVITAAHCTNTEGTYAVLTSFGTYFSSNIVNHSDGSSVNDPHDVSFIILSSDVADPNSGQVYPLGDRPEYLERVRLVGYGCNDLETRLGAGLKRTGTNQIYRISEYLELVTPLQSGSENRSILGPENRAGSCFGDSGGPLLRETEEGFSIVGVAHAGAWNDEYTISMYTDLNRYDNLIFMRGVSDDNNLVLFDACRSSDFPSFCNAYWSSLHIFAFLKNLWIKLLALF